MSLICPTGIYLEGLAPGRDAFAEPVIFKGQTKISAEELASQEGGSIRDIVYRVGSEGSLLLLFGS